MITTINNKLIRSFRPCYDPSKYIDETENLPIKQGIKKYRGIVPAKDILWLLCRNEFLSDRDLRLFAVWCARDALSLIDSPDPHSIAACDVAERYAHGEASQEELMAAYASSCAAAAAKAAAYAAYAASAADAADAAANATYAARAADAADYAADYAADAARSATREKQLNKLLTYFN